ncbi:MAG: SCP2 sterol-binding domain-containing protein [Myxococcales bacterium]|nr:SCP2 sterol-binding domain-containing protein [Myxococcales bacterium]
MTQPSVTLAPGSEDNALAGMLATLVRQNLDDSAEKVAVFAKMWGRVAIVATDLDTSLTLRFERGTLRLFDGIVGIPDVTVRATSEAILQLSLVELEPRFGLPDPRGENARRMIRASLHGEVQVFGLFPHLPLVLRLTRLMAVP